MHIYPAFSDGIYARIPYDSHDGTDTFTLGTPQTGAIDIDVDEPSGEFRRVSAGSFLDDGFELGCTFTGAAFAGMVTESGTGDETLTSDGWSFLTSQQALVYCDRE